MRIGLDMDGVLYSWDAAVRAMIREEFGIVVPQSEYWEFIKDFAGTKVWKWLWAHPGNVQKMFSTGVAYPGAAEGARALSEFGKIHILTSGPPGCEAPKIEWLESRGIPFHNFTRFDHGESKMSARASLYIDDNPVVISEVKTRGILVDRPWNTGENTPLLTGRWVRAHGWDEILAEAGEVFARGE